MKRNVPFKKNLHKSTVKEELEYWNVIHLLERLKIYYRERLRGSIKDMQGLEAHDFAMYVLEKIISEDASWQNSKMGSFIDFVYSTARGHLSHWVRDTKSGTFISYDDVIPKEEKRIHHRKINEVTYYDDEFNGF